MARTVTSFAKSSATIIVASLDEEIAREANRSCLSMLLLAVAVCCCNFSFSLSPAESVAASATTIASNEIVEIAGRFTVD